MSDEKVNFFDFFVLNNWDMVKIKTGQKIPKNSSKLENDSDFT